MGFDGPRIERCGAFEVLIRFLILMLSQENASKFDVGRPMVRMILKEDSKDRDSLILLANRIICKGQVIGSGNLVSLRLQAFFERGLGFAVLAL